MHTGTHKCPHTLQQWCLANYLLEMTGSAGERRERDFNTWERRDETVIILTPEKGEKGNRWEENTPWDEKRWETAVTLTLDRRNHENSMRNKTDKKRTRWLSKLTLWRELRKRWDYYHLAPEKGESKETRTDGYQNDSSMNHYSFFNDSELIHRIAAYSN